MVQKDVLLEKDSGSEKYMGPKNFVSKKIRGPLKFESKKYFGENAHEGDPAVTGRVMDILANEVFYLVCNFEHLEYTDSRLQTFFLEKSIGA